QLFAHPDDEHARPTLRDEVTRIDDERIEPVAEVRQHPRRREEVAAAPRREEADDILEHHDRWPAPAQTFEHLGEAEECRGMLAVEPAIMARKGQVDARKGGGGEEGRFFELFENGRRFADVFKMKRLAV